MPCAMDPSTAPSLPQRKYACTLCARRKVKCDKVQPCYNCSKSKAECHYQNPALLRRQRKRREDSDPLTRRAPEYLLGVNNIEFNMHDTDKGWISWDKTRGKRPAKSNVVVNAVPTRIEQTKTGERTLWSSLNIELQYPPLLSRRLKTGSEEKLGITFSLIPLSTTPDLRELHPEPKHILRLWQVFVENVNPIIKIVHVPTLQQRIFEASWNLQAIPKETEALMFAIYLLAVASLTASDCQTHFGHDRSTLLKRFNNGALQSLMAVDVFSTRELEVLQAFVLFLLAAPNSDTSTTLMAVAVRLAQKMVLHSERGSLRRSFFEREMQIRLWWQIQCLDGRARQEYMPPFQELGNVRMPLNLNDSELHPDMVTCPVEHVGATEMTYCLLKYEGARWQQKVRSGNKPPQANTTNTHFTMIKEEAIRDLELVFEEKYLRFCDTRIPLHFLSLTVSRLAICSSRFRALHPRVRPDGDARMTREERDVLFEQSVLLLELENESRKTGFYAQLLTHMARSKLDALIYTLSELRVRLKGNKVITAWNLAALFFEKHREWLDDTENSFARALGDLTLEAWQVRWKELGETQGGRTMDDITPLYIRELQEQRQKERMLGHVTSEGAVADVQITEMTSPAARLQVKDDVAGQLWDQIESEASLLGMPVNFEDDDTYDLGFWSEILQN